jgi:hypothetical protein
MRRSAWLAVSLVLLSTGAVSAFAQCGVERWTIKIGTEAGRPGPHLKIQVQLCAATDSPPNSVSAPRGVALIAEG